MHLAVLLTLGLTLGIDPGSPEAPRDGFVYGRVVRVSDGDTLTIVTADERVFRVRLAEIDAPERGEPFARRARRALERIVAGRDVAVDLVDVDRYARIVGRVYTGETDVNAEMVRAGLAVVYRYFAEDPALFELERGAREAGRGLWSQERLPEGAGSGDRPVAVEECGAKRRCAEMESCREALFYLNVCGVSTLDGDSDGWPCERSRCRAGQLP